MYWIKTCACVHVFYGNMASGNDFECLLVVSSFKWLLHFSCRITWKQTVFSSVCCPRPQTLRLVSFSHPAAEQTRPPSSQDAVSWLLSCQHLDMVKAKQQCTESLSSLRTRQRWSQGDIFGFWRRGVKVPERDLQLPLRIRSGTLDSLKAPAAGSSCCAAGVQIDMKAKHTHLRSLFIPGIPHNQSKEVSSCNPDCRSCGNWQEMELLNAP